MPKISVLMPVYNAEKFLDESISSILNQTFKDFDFFILDDASQDKSLDIMQKYEKKDSRIKVLKNKINKKANISRNILLSAVKTEFFAWMDADDISFQPRLQTHYNFLQNNPDIDIVGSASKNRIWIPPKTDYQIKIYLLLLGCPLINSSTMIRTKIIKKHNIRYKIDLSSAHDFQFWVDCAPFVKFANLTDKLIQYRVHSGQLSQTNSYQQKNFHLQIMQEHFQKFNIKISKNLLKIITNNNDEKLTSQNLIQLKNIYFKPIFNIKNFYGYPKIPKDEIAKIFLGIFYQRKYYDLTLLIKFFWQDKQFFFKIIINCLKIHIIYSVKNLVRKFSS